MPSSKDSLQTAIEHLSEEQARQVLAFLQSLAGDSAIRPPRNGAPNFGPVEPAPGKGQPASRLLIDDRR